MGGKWNKNKDKWVFLGYIVCVILLFYYGVICGVILMFVLKVFSVKSVCGVL